MLIYHGSHTEVRTPKILLCGRVGDFGHGFYTTSSYQQACRWAQIRALQEQRSEGCVTTFEIPDTLFENHSIRMLQFSKADKTWLDFVLANRKDPTYNHSFDIVTGPVANDRVYTCLNALENGFADYKTILHQLKTYVLADQILFHTAKALLFLDYRKTETIPCSPK